MDKKNWFIKRWLLQGMVVALPVVLTAAIFYFVVVKADEALWMVWDLFFDASARPKWFPGLGFLIVVSSLVFIGFLTESWLVRTVIDLFNRLLSRVPFVKNIYSTIHKIVQTVIGNKNSLSKVVLIEYPSEGSYCLAFLTSDCSKELSALVDKEMVNVFLPTTPNPTSGFYLIVPKNKVTETGLSSEEAFKLIISAGIVQDK
jgi:uncharacterized membrane protein